jgi:membrane associated rhomboid family serine protease
VTIGGVALASRSERWWGAARRWAGRPGQARVTVTYLSILVATTLVLRTGSTRLSNAILRSASTNLSNLGRAPITVLVTSACFVTSQWELVQFALVALLLLGPLEQRIGGKRWLLGFAAGHVGATLVVAAGLSVARHAGRLDVAGSSTIDVGVSYGSMALFVVLAHLWKGWARVVLAVVIAGYLLLGLLDGSSFTAWGHVAAAAIGLALGPFLVGDRARREVAAIAPPGAAPPARRSRRRVVRSTGVAEAAPAPRPVVIRRLARRRPVPGGPP